MRTLSDPVKMYFKWLTDSVSDWYYSSLSTKDPNSKTLNSMLWESIYQNNTENVSYYLSLGADPNTKTQIDLGNGLATEQTPLIYAADNSNHELAKLLIQHGAEINVSTRFTGNPLYYAVFNGDSEMVALLLDSGANTETFQKNCIEIFPNLDLTPPEEQAQRQVQADAYCSSALYNSVLMSADVKIINLLIDAGVDKSLELSPLHLAVLKGDSQEISHLLSENVDVSVKDAIGFSPVFYAVAVGFDEGITLLTEHGAILDDNCLRQAVYQKEASTLETVIELGGNVDQMLFTAVAIENEKAVDILLKHGADPYFKPSDSSKSTFDVLYSHKSYQSDNLILKSIEQKLLNSALQKDVPLNLEDVISLDLVKQSGEIGTTGKELYLADVISLNKQPTSLQACDACIPTPSISNFSDFIQPVISELQ